MTLERGSYYFRGLEAKRMRVDNSSYMAVIRGVFGQMAPAAITPVHIYQFRDRLAAKSGNVRGNRHLEMIKHVFAKARHAAGSSSVATGSGRSGFGRYGGQSKKGHAGAAVKRATKTLENVSAA